MTANMALLSPATAGTAAVAAAAAAAINRPSAQVVSSSLSPPSDSIKSARASLRLSPLPRTAAAAAAAASIAANTSRTRKWKVSCEVALKSDAKPSSSSSSSSSSSAETGSPSVSGECDGSDGGSARIGARVRVKVPLKVYHVPRVPEVDLTGMEGELKQYVADFKGKRISANLPCKVQFVKEIEGRGPVKFFAHLKEDEFEAVELDTTIVLITGVLFRPLLRSILLVPCRSLCRARLPPFVARPPVAEPEPRTALVAALVIASSPALAEYVSV
ncbi:hypothetical protein NL676_037514 [Syzygium grande]|nr:hypothetical protein NL676_037514 [Syzygium grande]